jgi:hypothetical protein
MRELRDFFNVGFCDWHSTLIYSLEVSDSAQTTFESFSKLGNFYGPLP